MGTIAALLEKGTWELLPITEINNNIYITVINFDNGTFRAKVEFPGAATDTDPQSGIYSLYNDADNAVFIKIELQKPYPVVYEVRFENEVLLFLDENFSAHRYNSVPRINL